jgi:hypothetical protein
VTGTKENDVALAGEGSSSAPVGSASNIMVKRGGGMAEERTIGQLVADATRDISEIVRAEIALAKAEIATSAKNGAMAGGLFGAAGYLAFLASILLVIAAAYGLVALGLAPVLAFLLVALGLLTVAGVLALIGRSRISRIGPPERTIRSAKQTIAAVRPGPDTPWR